MSIITLRKRGESNRALARRFGVNESTIRHQLKRQAALDRRAKISRIEQLGLADAVAQGRERTLATLPADRAPNAEALWSYLIVPDRGTRLRWEPEVGEEVPAPAFPEAEATPVPARRDSARRPSSDGLGRIPAGRHLHHLQQGGKELARDAGRGRGHYRLLHASHVLNIRGNSYRLKELEANLHARA